MKPSTHVETAQQEETKTLDPNVLPGSALNANKKPTAFQRLSSGAQYYKDNYGPLAAAAAIFAVSGYYTAGLSAYLPSVIPYGLTTLSGLYQQAALGISFTAFALSGIFLGYKAVDSIKALAMRTMDTEQPLSRMDWAVLASTAALGVAFLTTLAVNPSLVFLANASFTTKVAAAAATLVPTAASLYGMFKSAPMPSIGNGGAAANLDDSPASSADSVLTPTPTPTAVSTHL